MDYDYPFGIFKLYLSFKLRYLFTDLVSSSFSYHLVSIMMFSLHLIRSKHNYVEYIINHCIIYLYTILWFLNIIWMKYDIEVFKNYKKERKIHTDETSFKWYSVIIPPANKVWGGYIGITMSVRLSVRPSMYLVSATPPKPLIGFLRNYTHL